MTSTLKRALVIAAIVIAGLGALALRAVTRGRAALAEGDAALAARRPADAIAAWETAARWYLPGAPHVDEAYARLVRLAGEDPRHAPAAVVLACLGIAAWLLGLHVA